MSASNGGGGGSHPPPREELLRKAHECLDVVERELDRFPNEQTTQALDVLTRLRYEISQMARASRNTQA